MLIPPAETFPPSMNWSAVVPWGVFASALFFLGRFVRSVFTLEERVRDHGQRIPVIEALLVRHGFMSRAPDSVPGADE